MRHILNERYGDARDLWHHLVDHRDIRVTVHNIINARQTTSYELPLNILLELQAQLFTAKGFVTEGGVNLSEHAIFGCASKTYHIYD